MHPKTPQGYPTNPRGVLCTRPPTQQGGWQNTTSHLKQPPAPPKHREAENQLATSRTGTAKHRQWRQAVLTRDRNAGITHCPNCGVTLDYKTPYKPNSAEADHIIPHALGGDETLDNGRALCRRCNQRRGSLQRATKATTGQPTRQYTPLNNTQQW